MRGINFLAVAGAMLCGVTVAYADVNTYCAAYARNQADARLTGRAILDAAAKPTPEEWHQRDTQALADCLALYGPAPQPVARKPEAKAASPAALVPNSEAWKDYCAAKYASFNRDTGTYKSLSGKQRPCVVTRN